MLLLVPPGELDLARAPGPLPASTAASAIAAARRELLGEVRIVLGGHRIDKRNLPALVLPIGAAGRDNLANLVRWKVDIFILRGTFAQTMRKVMGHSAPCDPT